MSYTHNFDAQLVTDAPSYKSVSPGLESVVEEEQSVSSKSTSVFKRLFNRRGHKDANFDFSSVRHKASGQCNSPLRGQANMLTNTPSNRLSPRIAPLSYQIKKLHSVNQQQRRSTKGSSSSSVRKLELPLIVEPAHEHKTAHSQGYESVLRESSEVDINVDVVKSFDVSVRLSQSLPKHKPMVIQPPGSMAERWLSSHKFLSTFLAKYTVGDILGEGGFGFVISAMPKDGKSEVAVKFIFKDKVPIGAYIHDAELQTSLPFELFILRRIDYPHIIKLLEWFEDSAFYYLVTEMHGSEWVFGQNSYHKESQVSYPIHGRSSKRRSMDLFECIDVHKRFSEELAKTVFRQIVSAIDYLHNTIGIVHRDIKDENFVINKDYQVKLIDFGASSFIPNPNGGRLFSTFHGTPQYCSPEILKGEKYRGPEAEMWGLGVLLYTMLFGENPFNDPKNALDPRMDVRGLAMGCGLAVYIDEVCICDPRRRSSQRGSAPFELTGIRHSKQDLNAVFLTGVCVDFVDSMLKRNPYQRLTIEQARVHPWLQDFMEE